MHGDTSPEAQRHQDEAFRKMGPQRRVEVAADLSEAVFELSRTGIRLRHPTYDDAEVRLAELRLRLGDELFRAAFPGRPLLPA